MKKFGVKSITKNVDDCDKEYMKIKLSSDTKSSLNKTIEISTMTIVVRAVFHKNNCPQVFLGECLYKVEKWKVKIN